MNSCAKQLKNEYNVERTRLVSLCDKWQEFLDCERENYSDDLVGAIMAVIGQTKLLLSKKLKQFEGLLLERERSGGDGRTITDQDLRGYWEMAMIQVDVMVSKFNELDQLADQEIASEKSAIQSTARRIHLPNSNEH